MAIIKHPWLYRGKHLVSARHFDRVGLKTIFHATEAMKEVYLCGEYDPYASCLTDPQNRRSLRFRLLFWGNSTRTEGSFEDAIESLGGTVKTKQMEFSGAAKGESHWSITRILGPRCHGLIARDDSEEGKMAIPLMADAIEEYGMDTMFVNAGNGNLEHPTQMLLDIYSIWEQRKWELENGALTFGLVGDLWGSRTIHSFVVGVRHFGGKVILIGPEGCDIPQECYALAQEYPDLSIRRVTDIDSVVKEVDIWYFTRLQNNLRGEKLNLEMQQWYARTYGVNDSFRARIKSNALVLHPLPHGLEYPDEHHALSIDLIDQRFIHFKQADNGFHVRRATLALMHVPDFYTSHICGQTGILA